MNKILKKVINPTNVKHKEDGDDPSFLAYLAGVVAVICGIMWILGKLGIM